MKSQECQRQPDHCQYYYPDLTQATTSDKRLASTWRRSYWNLRKYVTYVSILGLRGTLRILPFAKLFGFSLLAFGRKQKGMGAAGSYPNLNLEPGDWVEVRPAEEILATLDANGKLKGLRFTPEMMRFCGKRFRVYKRLDKIILETTGELRKIRAPTVLLEGVLCDGKAHGGCDRSCFCFWREEWLIRARWVPVVKKVTR